VTRPVYHDEFLAILEQAPGLLGLPAYNPAVPPRQISVDLGGRRRGKHTMELAG